MRNAVVLLTLLLVLAAAFALPARKGELYIERGTNHLTNIVTTSPKSTIDVMDAYVNENFDASDDIPAGWTLIDGDGNGDSWYIYPYSPHSAPQSAGSIFISSTMANDDWLITPQVSVSAGDTLSFWYASQDSLWMDDLEVAISITGTDPADFTDVILHEELIPIEWNYFELILDDYDGEDIYVGFHNISLDRFVIKVDDVRVGTMADYDAAVAFVDTFNFYYDPDDSYTPGAIVYNMGLLPITVDVTCYVIHGGDTISSETLIADDVPFEGSLGLTFSPVALEIAEAVYTIAFEVFHAEDATASNNHSECYAYTYTTPATVLFQEFTATWCTWCSYPAVALHQIKNELGDSIAIASYHIWGEGDDPYWIGDEGDELCDAFGISGIPSTACTGSFYVVGGSTGDIDDEYDMYMSVFDYIANAVRTPVILDAYISAADVSGLDVEVIVQIVAEMQGEVDLKLHYLIIETDIDYYWVGEFPLDSLFDVVRAMLPTAEGVAVTEEEFLDEQHFDIDPSWNTDHLLLIAFVQDGTNGYVYYAVEQEIDITGIAEKSLRPGTFDLTCTPNPFNAAAEIAFSIPEDGMVELTVYDLNGRSVKTLAHENREAGVYTTIWTGDSNSGKDVPAGMYLVKLTQGEMTRTQKIALIK